MRFRSKGGLITYVGESADGARERIAALEGDLKDGPGDRPRGRD